MGVGAADLRATECAGIYSLELAARFPHSTLLALEPNRSVWEQHTTLATRSRRSHLACLNNAVTEEVAEALAHSNEFLDLQLLTGLLHTRPFDHGVSVSAAKREALDRFVAHLLSMARRSLLLLPGASSREACRDNRLANWVDGAPGARLEAAAQTLRLRLHARRLLHGMALDGCPYELWEVGLAHMDRLNRHHFCLGGCKTHTRRSYRLIYSAASNSSAARSTSGINMSNVQTGRRIPFETGSFNMHSLLSLHAPAKGVAAAVLRRRLPERHPPPQQPARWLVSCGSGRRR